MRSLSKHVDVLLEGLIFKTNRRRYERKEEMCGKLISCKTCIREVVSSVKGTRFSWSLLCNYLNFQQPWRSHLLPVFSLLPSTVSLHCHWVYFKFKILIISPKRCFSKVYNSLLTLTLEHKLSKSLFCSQYDFIVIIFIFLSKSFSLLVWKASNKRTTALPIKNTGIKSFKTLIGKKQSKWKCLSGLKTY